MKVFKYYIKQDSHEIGQIIVPILNGEMSLNEVDSKLRDYAESLYEGTFIVFREINNDAPVYIVLRDFESLDNEWIYL